MNSLMIIPPPATGESHVMLRKRQHKAPKNLEKPAQCKQEEKFLAAKKKFKTEQRKVQPAKTPARLQFNQLLPLRGVIRIRTSLETKFYGTYAALIN